MSKAKVKTKKKEDNTSGKAECVYVTIASLNRDFSAYDEIQVYDTIEEARSAYMDDIKSWKEAKSVEAAHFGILEKSKEKIDKALN